MSAMGKERESASEVVSPPAFPTIRSAAAMYLSISVDGFLYGKVAHTNIEFRDGGETQLWKITVGEVDWIEPTDRVHCAVNVGKEIFEAVVTFFLDRPDAEPQPEDDSK